VARDTFAIDVKKFGAKTDREVRLIIRRVVLDVFGKIVKQTPVGNPDNWKRKRAPPGYAGGRLRGNWQTTVGKPAEGEIERRQPEKKGAVQAESEWAAVRWNGEGSIFLTNNLPYAEKIESGTHSTQAPAGMVRVTLAEYPGIVRKRAAEARRR
jgi:hypothetical protein